MKKHYNARRVTMHRDGAKQVFVVTAEPFPEVGDLIRKNSAAGVEVWNVTRVVKTNVVASISFPAKVPK